MSNKAPSMLTKLPALAAIAVLGGACSTTQPTIDTSAGVEPTFDDLYPVRNSAADEAWARADLDLSGYHSIMLDEVAVEYRPGGESNRTYAARSRTAAFEVTAEQRRRFETLMAEVFRDELAKSTRFTLADEPGPDTLLIHAALLDVVSFVPPDVVGRSDIYLSRVGEATLVLELRDSVTEAILARAIDRKAAERNSGQLQLSNRVTNTAEVRRVAQAWARSLRDGLERFAETQHR